jgi:excisionase family DNA binding protein
MVTADKQPETLLTTTEVAELFGVHPQTVRRWGKEGRLREVRMSSQTVRFSSEEVRALIRRETR